MKKINLDKDILTDLYFNEDYTAAEIGKLLNVSSSTVQNYLHKYSIKIKGAKYFHMLPKIIFSNKQYDFFDGLIFSDGSVVVKRKNNGSIIGNCQVSCGFKYKEFAEYINKFLTMNSSIGIKKSNDKRYINTCITYSLMSPSNILFTEERQRWYPNGKKIIPPDFRFSPISMNIAYLGDGHLDKTDKYILISTQAFDTNSLENIIIKKLHDIKIECWLNKQNNIYIPKRSVSGFLNFIGDCPIECYKYKWKK